MKIDNYVKNVLVFLIILFVWAVSSVKAEEDNKTVVLKEWTTQIIYDTTNVCYEGTIRWILMSHPSLLGQPPTMQAQRQMIVHCFCVMDRIRKEIKIEEYQKLVYSSEWIGTLFTTKAAECIKEEKTLPSFFGKQTIETDNSTIVPNGETEDSKVESPDQKQEESEGSPQTIFQG